MVKQHQITMIIFAFIAQINLKATLMITGVSLQSIVQIPCSSKSMLKETQSRQNMKKDTLKTCLLKTSLRMIRNMSVLSRAALSTRKVVETSWTHKMLLSVMKTKLWLSLTLLKDINFKFVSNAQMVNKTSRMTIGVFLKKPLTTKRSSS